MAPNVLLVVLDAARVDTVEPYAATGRTPTIAELARRGRAVPRAYSTACWTLPSHASIFTGLLPRALGVHDVPGGSPQAARPAFEAQRGRMLSEVLRRAGYRTQAVSANLWVSPYAGFDVGFDDFEYLHVSRQIRMEATRRRDLLGGLAWAREGVLARGDDGARRAGDTLRRWIDDWSGTPTFWFVNVIECHSPYLPPRPWNELGALDRLRAALEARRYLGFEAICRVCTGALEVPPHALSRMRRLYRGAVSYMDHWLGDVLSALDRKRVLDETLVVVTSDHGENIGEDGLVAHAFSLDERLIHVPLVMAGPGVAADEGAESSESGGALSLASLPRLIAQAIGLERHPWPAEELPKGVAVAQLDPMAPAEDPRVRDFAARWDLSKEGLARLTAEAICATDGRLRLEVRGGEERLYEVHGDRLSPIGTVDASDGAVSGLRAALSHPAATAIGRIPAPGGRPAPSEEELGDLERRMRLLGYM